jgi:hypothetical protein
MTAIPWLRDPDQGFKEAQTSGKMVLLDFSAAPMWGGCARLDAEVYPQEQVAKSVNEHFIPVKIHIKERPQDFSRFKADWTPTLILAEADGAERHRVVGFLPADDFLAQLHLGLAKAAFSLGQFGEAKAAFEMVATRHPQTDAAPEAVYWTAVSGYKASGDPEFLKKGGAELRDRWPQSEWAKKGSVWVS